MIHMYALLIYYGQGLSIGIFACGILISAVECEKLLKSVIIQGNPKKRIQRPPKYL